jgi:iron complex transport system permease protein
MTWIVLGVLFGALLVVHICFGGVFSLSDVWTGLLDGPGTSPSQTVVWDIRLPRAIGASLVGANLACVGAVFQSLFRNPLADPFIMGVSSAAAVGGAIATLLPIGLAVGISHEFATFLCAFVTAILGMGAVLGLARGTRGPVANLIIAGAGIGSFLWALVTFILMSAGQDSGRVLAWLLGSLVGVTWQSVIPLFFFGLVGFAGLLSVSRALTVFTVGEDSSARLGVDVPRLKWQVLIYGTAMAAAAVASVGIVGFVGLFTPHIARRLVGPNVRPLLVASGLLGASAVLFADTLAQRLVFGQEVNLGVVTALLGAPFLVGLLRRH